MKNEEQFFIVENIDLGRRDSLSWVEESYDQGVNLPEESNPDFLSLSLPRKKVRFLLWFICAVVIVLFARSFYLQIISGGYYYSLAEDNRIRSHAVPAQRGIIYDRNGKVLVNNISGFSLVVVPADLPINQTERQTIISQIATISGLDQNEVEKTISSASQYYFQPIVIKTGIGYDEAMALKIASVDLPGINIETDAWRYYPLGRDFAHILGYVGKINAQEYEQNKSNYLLSDNMGKTGLEKIYEKELRGIAGERRMEVDSLGREKKIVSEVASIPGNDLILSIDADLQDKIFQIIDTQLQGKKTASIVVSDPRNGEILAMVDYPSYDNNLFAKGISQADYQKLLDDENKPLFFRAISGEYPSGSTVKIVEAAGALQEKIININTTINSVGGIGIGQWFFPDWKAGGHGLTNVTKAIAWSVNSFFYYIGGGYGDFKGMGVDLLDKYFSLFGLGEKMGIDLPGERSGLVPTPEWKKETKKESWYVGDTYHLSIGQGDLLVTPLQVNSYTATIANNGKVFVPHVVAGVAHPDGSVIGISPAIIRQDFIDSDNLTIVRQGMRETITYGSGRALLSLPVTVAGKTGTAQWNLDKPNHAWFTAFAPYDAPTFCITVLVEQGGEGSSIAAPIAKDIIAYWFTKNN
ncbi:MAG: penicillin-binding protein 2 [bacterium]